MNSQTRAAVAIKSTVTGQWLVDFCDDQLTGRGPQSIPVWGGREAALPAAPCVLEKVAKAGIRYEVAE
jgi:hypothetical protein